MKKFTLIALACFSGLAVFGQRRSAVLSAEKLSPVHYQNKVDQLNEHLQSQSMLQARPFVEETTPALAPNGKTAAVNAIQIGKASNVFTILRAEQNQVWADESLELVTFIHRHDINTWGGSDNGRLRYDLSTDGGATFAVDLGEINPLYQRPARYPNMTGYNPAGNTNPFSSFVVYSAPTLDPSPDWDGHVTGKWTVDAATPTGTENYALLNSNSYLQGGLTEGLPGEFWTVDRGYDGNALLGDIYLNKGTYNTGTQDIDWVREDTISPPHNLSFDGNPRMVGPNIAFSPDGMTGWIAWLGDLTGGSDSTYNPCFLKSTDGGATWGTPVEYDLNAEAWVYDTLRTLWTDSAGNILSTGRATGSFEYDVQVDKFGNAHMGLIVCSAGINSDPLPSYSLWPQVAKFYADIHTKDGGATWSNAYISPVLTFRTIDFTSGTTTISMDNQPQIARNASGDKIFYSWADSDTATVTGTMNGIGFGASDNLAPNLRIAAMDVVTGAQTYPKLITDADLYWEGLCLFPTLAPEVLVDDNTGEYQLPIVFASMLGNDPLQTTTFYYLGNDALIDEADFCDPATMTLGWDQFTDPNATLPCDVLISADPKDGIDGIMLGASYPNPTAGEAAIPFELPATMNVSLTLVNVYGQEVAVMANGEFAAGQHVARVNTADLAAGVYFYRLSTEGKVVTKRMVVTK